MRDRRMFSKRITTDDQFLDMPSSSQCLYFHLCLDSDDEGFISSPKRVMRSCGSNEDDLKILITKGFVIPFESGVVVIRHWYVHNTIRQDRKKNTLYRSELVQLTESAEGIYELNHTSMFIGNQVATNCQPTGNQLTTNRQPSDNQVATNCPPNIREVKISKIKEREGNRKEVKGREEFSNRPPTIYGKYHNVFLLDEEYKELNNLMGTHLAHMIERLSSYMESTGKTYNNHKATLENWYESDKDKLEKSKNNELQHKYKGFHPAPQETDYENEHDFCNLLRKETENE